MKAVDALLKSVADTIITPCFGKLSDDAVKTKSSPTDLVTIVDEEAEAALKAGLAEIAPSAGFIGEEAAAIDPTLPARVEGPGAWWIVDPLDGTRNFVQGHAEFATIVAFVNNGRTVAGWINAIPHDRLFRGQRGEGVSCNLSAIAPKAQTGETPSGLRSLGWLNDGWDSRIRRQIKDKVVTQAMHCSAYAYAKLLQGEFDFKISSRIHAWDHAAGVFMLEELGGAGGYLDDHEAYHPADSADRPMLATAPGRDWTDIASRLTG